MSSQRILLAGATGAVGTELLQGCKRRGHWVRTLSRSPQRAEAVRRVADEVVIADATVPSSLTGVADGVDLVVSCLGASVGLGSGERRPYLRVDVPANLNLLAAAQAAGVGRFVYVSLFVQPGYADTGYVRAHETVVQALVESGLSYTVVRPTGIFTALTELLRMAARGRAVVLGDGAARTNPIHPADVAAACLQYLVDGPPDAPIGGPDVLTRADIARTAFAALDRPPRLTHVPPWTMSVAAALARLSNPRLADLMTFGTRVATTDCVAPPYGRRRLADFFRDQARGH